jgi:hypothetical protein
VRWWWWWQWQRPNIFIASRKLVLVKKLILWLLRGCGKELELGHHHVCLVARPLELESHSLRSH